MILILIVIVIVIVIVMKKWIIIFPNSESLLYDC